MSSTSTLLLTTSPTATDTTQYTRLSASCQQLRNETIDPATKTVAVILRSCLADSEIYPSLAAHKCNDAALLPSGLWADMALVVGRYIWSRVQGRPKSSRKKSVSFSEGNEQDEEEPGLSICDMEIPKTMLVQIPQKAPGQWIELEATGTFSADNMLSSVACTFRSIDPSTGKKLYDHATCTVKYESKSQWRSDWSRHAHLVLSRINGLQQSPTAHVLQRRMIYNRLFKSFVDYGPKYNSMREVVMEGLEATALIDFQTAEGDYRPPYHIDGVGHLSGFISNASETLDESNVYASHGWGALKVLNPDALFTETPTKRKGVLRNYVHMQHKPNGILQGDVYVFEDDDVLAVWEAVKFKSIPRRVLNILLPPGKKA